MNFFRFSCDTNILYSASFYYKFSSYSDPYCEGTIYDTSKYIMDYFKVILRTKGLKFGILTQSLIKEARINIIKTLLKSLKRVYKKKKFSKILNETSAALNRISINFRENLKIFEIGKANINNKRVQTFFPQVEKMYKQFEKMRIKLRKGKKFSLPKQLRNLTNLPNRPITQNLAAQNQIMYMKQGYDNDKIILAELCYEKIRVIQDNPKYRKNLDFYFVSEDAHFSPKYVKLIKQYSRPITDEIQKQFDIECLRASEFCVLINSKQLRIEK